MPILVDTLLLLLWVYQKKTEGQKMLTQPKISILVAARNEEVYLAQCIEGLIALRYPSHLMEILIGDDASEDRTLPIANDYASRYSNLKVYKIQEKLPKLQGKANVLAQLAQQANGDYLFFTDADIVVPPDWIEAMLAGFGPKVGLVSGVTGIIGNTFWARFQFLDWAFALGMVEVVNDFDYSTTALGNNMAVSREAYKAVGGYEAIPFSVTEDFELLKQIKKKGYKGNQLFNKHVLAWSMPEPNWHSLLHQRKRWMQGALQLPVIIVAILTIQALFFPALLLLLLFNPALAIFIFIVKVFVQGAFIYYGLSKIGQRVKVLLLLVYEFYSTVLSLSLLIFYCLPIKMNWKGRRY